MKVAVDPGHGMSNATSGVFDPGAMAQAGGETFREADFTLRYGLSLKDVLRSRGIEVFMTRDDHEDPAPVGQRAGNAERAGCDVFVSLHMNSADAPSANGLEVLFRDGADAAFAKDMHDELVAVTGLRPRGTPQRNNLAVLRFNGPAILIELGFISNVRDRTELLNPETRARVCNKIADVLVARFGAGASIGRPTLVPASARGPAFPGPRPLPSPISTSTAASCAAASIASRPPANCRRGPCSTRPSSPSTVTARAATTRATPRISPTRPCTMRRAIP
jgi:N-acetylmuramoyl-L-alanine amidase